MEKIKLVPPTVTLPPEELDRRLQAGLKLLEPFLWDLVEKRLKEREEQEASGSSSE